MGVSGLFEDIAVKHGL